MTEYPEVVMKDVEKLIGNAAVRRDGIKLSRVQSLGLINALRIARSLKYMKRVQYAGDAMADYPEVFVPTEEGLEFLSVRQIVAKAPAAKPETTSEPTKATALEAFMGNDMKEIMEIVNARRSASEKMRAICGIDQRYLSTEYDSPFWSAALNVSEGAIRKCLWWKAGRHEAIKLLDR